MRGCSVPQLPNKHLLQATSGGARFDACAQIFKMRVTNTRKSSFTLLQPIYVSRWLRFPTSFQSVCREALSTWLTLTFPVIMSECVCCIGGKPVSDRRDLSRRHRLSPSSMIKDVFVSTDMTQIVNICIPIFYLCVTGKASSVNPFQCRWRMIFCTVQTREPLGTAGAGAQ